MIDFKDILRLDCARARLSANTQKAALEAASEILAEALSEIDARALLEGLMARERLGSTGLGFGVAIPHCRLVSCAAPAAALLTLDSSVDFDAPDDRDVDILFVLAVPDAEERAHLEILSALAQVFDDETNLEALRGAHTDRELFDVMQDKLATVTGQ